MNINYKEVLPYLKMIVESHGIVIISDIHGETNGPNLASKLVKDISGNKKRYLLLEVPGEHTNQTTDTCLNAYYNYTDKNDVSFSKDAMDNLVTTAVNNDWQIRASDCARYISGFGKNGVVRQDYIARQIKQCHKLSEGVIAVNGSRHVSGQKKLSYTPLELKRLKRSGLGHFSALSYLLSGVDGRIDKKVRIFNVYMPTSLRSTKKRLEVHTIPAPFVAQDVGYEGGLQGM